VGRLLRPELRNLDVALLEHDLAAFVADDGVTELPFDFIERIDPFLREESRERQSGREGDRLFRTRLILVFFVSFVLFEKRFHRRWRTRPHTALDRLLSCTCRLVARAFLHVPSTPDDRASTIGCDRRSLIWMNRDVRNPGNPPA